MGRRGGIQVDTSRKTVRLVLLDGQKIGYGQLQADVGTGRYDLTFYHDKVVGVSEGPGRFIHVIMPEGIVQLPALTIGGIGYAPGTFGNIAIVPVLDGRCEFTLENLPQAAGVPELAVVVICQRPISRLMKRTLLPNPTGMVWLARGRREPPAKPQRPSSRLRQRRRDCISFQLSHPMPEELRRHLTKEDGF